MTGRREPGQSLDRLTARLLTGLGDVMDAEKPDRVIVQGDTATAMVGALAAYYRKVPVSHVEAGLRTDNIYSPWPEEVNRRLVSQVADLHFAPTTRARENLLHEGIGRDRIVVTGNTGIDALLWVSALLDGRTKLRARVEKIKCFELATQSRDMAGGLDPMGVLVRRSPSSRSAPTGYGTPP